MTAPALHDTRLGAAPTGVAAHRVIFKDNIDDLRVLNYFSTCVDGSAQKTLIHFGATQTPGKTIRSEPRAWYCDTPSILRIKDSFAKA